MHRDGPGRHRRRDSKVPRRGRMLDRLALRDTWQVAVASRALIWVVAIVAVLRFGLEPKITPPHEVVLRRWTPQLLGAPAGPGGARAHPAGAPARRRHPPRGGRFPPPSPPGRA